MIPGTRRRRRLALLSAVVLSLTFAVPVSGHGGDHRPHPKPKPDPIVNVQVLAFNDYHGHLEATTPGTVGTTPAGGSEYLATHLDMLREGHRNTVTVAAGDLIGGTPFLSGIFHDEPSVESLNALGLDVSSVGNHEFDQGVKELRRMQYGGCHPVDGCYFPDDPYPGADFPWLAANVVKEGTKRTVLPPYWIKKFQGVKVGFIGMTLEDTPSLVAQSGIEGWQFKDEVETANALVPKLRRLGVEAIVVLLHEGGLQTGTFDQCVGISGPIVEIQAGLHPEIDLLVTGHTHQPYNCVMTDPAGKPRHVTSAFSFGRIISEIDLPINKRTGEVVRADVTVVNHLVDQTVAKDPQQTAIIAKWKSISDAVGNKPVGNITATIARGKTASGSEDRAIESDLGNMIADAQLWASLGSGAQLALMNPGGVRGDLLFPQATGEGDGVVTYAEAFTVQPFGNLMSTMPMTGAQIKAALVQQCQPSTSSRPFLHLGVSAGVTYDLQKTITVDAAGKATCTAITVSNLKLNGVDVADGTTYMVAVNNFLADGGDNFAAFKDTPVADRIGGGIDLDQLNAYLGTQGPIAPPGTNRVNELP